MFSCHAARALDDLLCDCQLEKEFDAGESRGTLKMMRSGIVHMMAMMALLVQAVFGTVAPVAVLCMHHGTCEPITEVHSPQCAVHSCCDSHAPQEAALTQVEISIASPCDEDCQSCVDVGLPDHDLATVDRADVLSECSGVDHVVASIAGQAAAPVISGRLVSTTGPPLSVACLHAPILSSTRLLI